MIGKQIKGTGFRGCLSYVLGKKGAYIIGGTMCGQTPEALATEFAITRLLKPRLKMAVFHATLSLDATEKLDSDAENDRRWCAIADDYMKAMGFHQNQYVVVKHTNTQHDHIHIVGSRIRFDGTVVDDSWDYYKSQAAIRTLEAQYNLQQIAPSWECDKRYCSATLSRTQTTGEYRKHRSSGNKSVRVQLQAVIDECAEDNPTMLELIERLQEKGTEVQVRLTRTGCIKGISYQLNGVPFSGTGLGKAYTFKGLQKYRGVSYEPDGNTQIELLMQQQEAIASSNMSLSETDAATDTTDSDSDTFALIDSLFQELEVNDLELEQTFPIRQAIKRWGDEAIAIALRNNIDSQSESTLPSPTAQQIAQTDAIILIAFDALIGAEQQQQVIGQYEIFWYPQKLELSIVTPDKGEILKAAFTPEGTYQLQVCQIAEKDLENFQAFERQQQLERQSSKRG